MTTLLNATILNYQIFIFLHSPQTLDFQLPATAKINLYRQNELFLTNVYDISPGTTQTYLSCASHYSQDFLLCNQMLKNSQYDDYFLEIFFYERQQISRSQTLYAIPEANFVQNLTILATVTNELLFEIIEQNEQQITNVLVPVLTCYQENSTLQLTGILKTYDNKTTFLHAQCQYILDNKFLSFFNYDLQILQMYFTKCASSTMYYNQQCTVELFDGDNLVFVQNGIAIQNELKYLRKDKLLEIIFYSFTSLFVASLLILELIFFIKHSSNKTCQ